MSIANWVKETTATTGTGTITLSGAVDNAHTTFASQIDDGIYVNYTIEDGDDRENAVGLYSAGTLTRFQIRETIVSGVLDKTAPTALNLSGSATVAIVPSATNTFQLPVVDNRASRYLFSAFQSIQIVASGSTSILVEDRLYIMPYTIPRRAKLAGLGIREIVTASTSGVVGRVGLYAEGIEGKPGKLIAEPVSVFDMGTTGLNKWNSFEANIELRAGNYYIGILTDSNAKIRALTNESHAPLISTPTANGTANANWVYYNITSGWSAMPATLDGVTETGFNLGDAFFLLMGRTV